MPGEEHAERAGRSGKGAGSGRGYGAGPELDARTACVPERNELAVERRDGTLGDEPRDDVGIDPCGPRYLAGREDFLWCTWHPPFLLGCGVDVESSNNRA